MVRLLGYSWGSGICGVGVFVFVFEILAGYIVQTGLELAISLLLHLSCWDHPLSHHAQFTGALGRNPMVFLKLQPEKTLMR